MKLLPKKFFRRDYWQMALTDKLSFLQRGVATIRGHRVHYPYWPNFYGIFYEIFIDDNYRIDGLTDVKHIVDAGANIGISAVYFAETYSNAKIDCFEPNPEALAYLRKNVAAYPQVTVHPYAVGKKDGELIFHVDSEIVGSSIASAANLLASKRRPSREVTVECRKLSIFITEPVDILKMDIEGGEIGAMDDLVASGKIALVRSLLMEFHHVPETLPSSLAAMLTLLEQQDFSYYIRRGAPTMRAEPSAHSYIIFAFRKNESYHA